MNDREVQYADLMMKTLATFVEQKRRRLNCSQEELAKKAGVSRAYLSDVERGLRNISLLTFSKLSKALEIEASALLKLIEDAIEEKLRSGEPAQR